MRTGLSKEYENRIYKFGSELCMKSLYFMFKKRKRGVAESVRLKLHQ
jgi:hypothetical protein